MRIDRTGLYVLAAIALLLAPCAAHGRAVTQGRLDAIGEGNKQLGPCPLKHTDVTVSISGPVVYVSVTQKFANPFQEKIEAVYTFPLGADAAVNEMMMVIGDRQILGKVKPREEARKVYEQAKAAGHVAGLLDQQRANIFTQAVANIEPGEAVEVTIGYTQTLKYEDGTYRFVFPMVVGPRFIPSAPPPPTVAPAVRRRGAAPAVAPPVAPPASVAPAVPDAGKITPPVTPKGTRAGHDIAIHGWITTGVPIRSIEARLHEVRFDWLRKDHSRAKFELVGKKTLPNKDFVLEFSAMSDRIEDAVLAHTDERAGYFLLMLQPPKKVQPKEVRPRELIFVIDTSGSQKGFPLETSQAIALKVIRELRERDTFNVIAFANSTSLCWDAPVANTPENREKGLAFVEALKAGGGTRIDKAITAALEGEHDPQKLRIVAFFSDGLIGHDLSVLDQVRKNAKTTRVFVYGTGNSANRYLLDNMALFGRGEADYALKKEEADRVARTFYSRIDAPVLTDIEIDWGELADRVELAEAYPRPLPDLFSARPVVVKGRYKPGSSDASGTITIRGRTGAGDFSRRVAVTLPAKEGAHGAIADGWARAKVADLMSRDLQGAQSGKPNPGIKEAITALGVNYRLVTQYTSFVAVERKRVTKGGKAVTVEVPVEMPEGMSYEGVFGNRLGRPNQARALALFSVAGRRPGASAAGTRGRSTFGGAMGSIATPALTPVPAPTKPGALALPRPRFAGTPKLVPPGTRIRPGSHRPHGEYIIPKGVTNVALGKRVTASDATPVVGTVAAITDGNKEARQDTYVELGPKVQWIQIDLGKPHAIQALAVWHEHRDARVYHDVAIQIADDKDFTKNVRTVFNNDHDNTLGLGVGKDWEYFETNRGLVVKLKGIRARYVRLYSNGSTADDLNRYTEVEVYAPPAK